MNSLLVVFLALTAIATAVEAKGQTKKRGLEEAVLGYAQQNQGYALGGLQQNHGFPFGGPLDLGALQGIELKSFEHLGNSFGANYGSGLGSIAGNTFAHNYGQLFGNRFGNNLGYGLGSQGLALGGGNYHGLSSLGGLGQQGFGGYGQQYLNSLLGNSGLQAAQFGLSNNYASGYGLRTNSAPVSVPQVVPPAIAQSSQPQQVQQFGARATTTQALPTAAPIPPTAFPPTSDPKGIPPPVLPPAPLPVFSPAPATTPAQLSAPASESALAAAAAQQTTTALAPATDKSTQATTTTTTAGNAAPEAGRLGSGSLGYTNLGNGVFALGSGSLGYTSTSNPAPPPQVQVQQPQRQIAGYAGLQNTGLNGAAQLGQGLGAFGYGVPSGQDLQYLQYDGQQAALSQFYGGQNQNGAQDIGVRYTSTASAGQGQGLQLNQAYGDLSGALAGASQVQNAGYGGYSLNNGRPDISQAVLNAGYGGDVGSGAGALLAGGY